MADRGLQGTLAGSGNATTASSSTTSGPAAGAGDGSSANVSAAGAAKKKGRALRDAVSVKRRCVSTACIACRKRKSKCDGNTPSCAACSSVYGTECIYDPGSDHRRKGVYKDKTEALKAKESTFQTIVQSLIHYHDEETAIGLLRRIRRSENLDELADELIRTRLQEDNYASAGEEIEPLNPGKAPTTFETELSGKMGELRLENGTARFIGGTSNLIYLQPEDNQADALSNDIMHDPNFCTSWTKVTNDPQLINHLLHMYFNWHYPFFTCLSKHLFLADFKKGKPGDKQRPYCSSLLVNAMLALGCHFTSWIGACGDPNDPTQTDPATKGDYFFKECKRLIVENDEYEKPRLTTVQALALMSVREAGCGREAKGWVYSGMAFRMALDMGLNLDITTNRESMDENAIDARRVTFWGCFLFDKCWSNYLGRLPQLPTNNVTVPKIEVFPDEDADIWSPFTDQGSSAMHSQPARTRAVALQITALCEISSDLLSFFYHPTGLEKPMGKGVELKRLSELHTRLQAWRRDLPAEFESKEGQLPNILLMHMFNHLLYIHLFRPFLKYTPASSPLPSHVSPRKLCTAAAAQISKLMRLYKRTYGLRQICNIAVYIVHSACTIHLLNLPLADGASECALDKEGNGEDGKGKATPGSEQVGKAARRDIVHGVKHLEEIAEDWLCARRTLSILSVLSRKWKIDLPEEAELVLERTDRRYGPFSTGSFQSPSPKKEVERGYEGSQRSPFGVRPEEGVEFGGHGGAGCDRGRFGGTNVGDMVDGGSVQDFQSSMAGTLTATQGSSPYETQLSTPIMQDMVPQLHMQQSQQPPSPFGQEGQFANFMRFSPNRMSPNMQNPAQPNILHQAQMQQAHSQRQHTPQHQQMQPMQRQQHQLHHMHQTSQFDFIPRHQYTNSRPLSAYSATSAPSPNLATLTPGIQSVHGTPTTRNMSPVGLFGQVEALSANDATSQDWWLRDQAQIAVGFDNWGGGIANSGVGLGSLTDTISTPGLDGAVVSAEETQGMTFGMQGSYGNINNGRDTQSGNGNGNGTGRANNSAGGSGNPSPGVGGWYAGL